ncbi:MAG: phospholipase D-like domain-containing protein [Flammeovirgaceae bacterium]|jgi:cardiolipin synthase|nr:phospholipase D-like domain-containing protein [Flammeovirgaceae bacterium]
MSSSTSPEARLIHGGKEYFSLLKDLIGQAKESIYIQTYIFDEDQTGTDIANELRAAAQRGVKVFLLVDGYASGQLSHSFISGLKEAGIEFRMFDTLLKSKYFYLGRRLHHKVVTIDDTHALVGGMNISNRYNDLPNQPAWLDWAIYTKGEVALWLTYICQQRVKPGSLKRLLGKSPNYSEQFKNSAVSVKINDWVRGKKEITNSYLDMFRQATDTIMIMSAYFLPNDQFRKELKKAAQRGVKVKLILAGTSDIALAKYAERYLYRWLFSKNIEIYEYQKSILHGKLAVYDSLWSTVGSYNVNTISAYASIELNLAVQDHDFAVNVENTLQAIMLNDCVRITENQIQHAGLLKRFFQWCAYVSYQAVFFLFTFYFKQRE